jgi:arylsulfatase A-like enzyme
MPATQFKGKSGLGYRGDAILQLDWTVGQIMKKLRSEGMEKNTIIIFTSDNGPVLDDGYQDRAVTMLNGHTPAGALRGGKYSSLEGGTRIPFIFSWTGQVSPRVSDALVCQMDLLASFAHLLKQTIPADQATDSENMLTAFLGKNEKGRAVLVEQGLQAPTAIIKDGWKYIQPHPGAAVMDLVNIESGNSPEPQLYDLRKDIGEKHNIAGQFPDKVKELDALLNNSKSGVEK